MHLDYLLGIEMHCGKVSLWEYKGRGMETGQLRAVLHIMNLFKAFWKLHTRTSEFFLGWIYWLNGWLGGLSVLRQCLTLVQAGLNSLCLELLSVLWAQPPECWSGRHEVPHPA